MQINNLLSGVVENKVEEEVNQSGMGEGVPVVVVGNRVVGGLVIAGVVVAGSVKEKI